MAKFVSVLGKFIPAKESCSMVNTFGKTITSEFIVGPDGSNTVKPGENFLYNGPNREAVRKLKEQGSEYLGRDFRHHPEFLQAVRNMGFNNPEEYLKMIGFDEKAEYNKQMEKVVELTSEKNPNRKEEAYMLAGGQDRSGEAANNYIGGFGAERLRPVGELKK